MAVLALYKFRPISERNDGDEEQGEKLLRADMTEVLPVAATWTKKRSLANGEGYIAASVDDEKHMYSYAG